MPDEITLKLNLAELTMLYIQQQSKRGATPNEVLQSWDVLNRMRDKMNVKVTVGGKNTIPIGTTCTCGQQILFEEPQSETLLKDAEDRHLSSPDFLARLAKRKERPTLKFSPAEYARMMQEYSENKNDYSTDVRFMDIFCPLLLKLRAAQSPVTKKKGKKSCQKKTSQKRTR